MVFKAMKDNAIAMALKSYLNDKFSEYGVVQSCTLDSRQGRLVLEAMLKGEKEPIRATLERFELVRENGKPFMVLHEFSSSRPWLATLLTRLFKDKRYPLPGTFAALL